jgi:CheY-like chemotaxis protein
MMDDATTAPHYGEPLPVTTLERMRILVVDDTEHMRKLLRQFLYLIGLRNVDTFGDAASALKALQHDDARLVITDLNMRPMNGLQLITAVRSGKNVANPAIPIVVLSGSSDLRTLKQALEAGANGILVKPVSLATLRERVLPLLPLHWPSEAKPQAASWAFPI